MKPEDKLLKDRIVLVGSPISEKEATEIIAKLLFLESQSTNKPITIYINSPGGSATAGLAIVRTMQSLKPKVFTVCTGQAHSMAAIILTAGSRGCRRAVPDAKITFSEIWSVGEMPQEKKGQLERLQTTLIETTSRNTGMTLEQTRTLFATSQTLDPIQARKLGIIDTLEAVIPPRQQ